MAVVLADLLDEEQVTLELRAQTRDQVLREMVAPLRSGALRQVNEFVEAVIARENVHTTCMENGVAFPHARTDLVQGIVLAIGRSTPGMEFCASEAPVHLIYLIGVPRRMASDYLVCVGTLARLTKDPTTRAALMQAETPGDFVELLRAGSLWLE